MRRLLPIVVVLAVALAAFYRFVLRDGEQLDELTISGNIEMTEVDIAFKTPGRLESLLVAEGDAVRAGDVLARLDRRQLEQERERAVANVASAQSALAQTQAAIRFQRASLDGAVAQREAAVRAARAALNALEAGSRRQDIAAARAAVERAEAEAVNARRDLERGRTLFGNEDISAQHFDRLVAQAEATEAALEQARQRYDLVQAGPRQEDVESGRAQLEQAGAALRAAEAGKLDIVRLERQLETNAAHIEAARAALGVVDAMLEDAVAVAPIDGVVLTQAAEEGEILAAGTTILTIADVNRPWLRGYINQVYQGRVEIGSQVEVFTDSFPTKAYRGRLSFVASEAEFTPKQIQTQEERVKLVYRVKIDIANPNQELKRNMPADAVIPLTPADGAAAAQASMRLP